jgi:pimeloyl-ACP methyl ester carboxylesterase
VHLAGFAGQPAGANGAGPVLGPVAEEIVRYIKVAGLKRPAIVGHSMGGTLGLMIAARHPDVLSRLMVVDMMPYLGAVFAPPGAGRDQVQAIAERIGAGMAGADAEQRRAGAIATMDAMVDNVAMRMVGVEDSVASDPVVSSHVYPELLKTDLGPELARITVPLTVLYVQPKSVPMPEAQFDAAYKGWYATVPNVTLKRMSESAHFIMWDQPARFQAALKAFLDPAGAAGT